MFSKFKSIKINQLKTFSKNKTLFNSFKYSKNLNIINNSSINNIVSKRNFFFKKKVEEPKVEKGPRIPLETEIALQGWGKKDWFFLTFLVVLGGYGVYSAYVENTEETLQKIKADLDSDKEEVIIKTLENFLAKNLGTSDSGALYLHYGILDKVLGLLNHPNVDIRKNAWRVIGDLKNLHSCEAFLEKHTSLLISHFTQELKRFESRVNKLEIYYEFLSIINNFSSIMNGKEVGDALLNDVMNMTLDGYTSGIYMQMVSHLAKDKNNALRFKGEIGKILMLSQNEKDFYYSKVALKRILDAVYETKLTPQDLGLTNKQIETAIEISEMESKSVEAMLGRFYVSMPEGVDPFLYGIATTVAIAVPWSFMRASFRLVPKRGFGEAFPMITKSIVRAVLGSVFFTVADELTQNRRSYFPNTVSENHLINISGNLAQTLSILVVWRYTPYAILPGFLSGLFNERYLPMFRRLAETMFDSIMTQQKLQLKSQLQQQNQMMQQKFKIDPAVTQNERYRRIAAYGKLDDDEEGDEKDSKETKPGEVSDEQKK